MHEARVVKEATSEITIDVVVQDRDGCLTVSGPLRDSSAGWRGSAMLERPR
jgi:hypothetical protein